jgi:hypothetical protein
MTLSTRERAARRKGILRACRKAADNALLRGASEAEAGQLANLAEERVRGWFRKARGS